MGCSCGSGSGGGCGSKGFDKLDVHDWMQDIPVIPGSDDIVEVKFKGTRKGFFRNIHGIELEKGELIAVEASPGHDIGKVGLKGVLAAIQLEKYGLTMESELRKIYRKTRPTDLEKWEEAKAREQEMMLEAREIVRKHSLEMKISDVEMQGDGNKATFYYIADERIDFRQLIKSLADRFKVRIEMRQIGARQEAGRVGGIGSCGRELCCSTWLTSFASVTTTAARQQELPPNSNKLTGQCGKLKCCLVYEIDSYQDAVKDFPPTDVVLETQEGRAFHQKTDVYKETMWYSYNKENSVNITPVPVSRVKEIVDMNRKGQKPQNLLLDDVQKTKPVTANSVSGFIMEHDSLTRFDNSNRPQKKKKRRRPGANQEGAPKENQRSNSPKQSAQKREHTQNKPPQTVRKETGDETTQAPKQNAENNQPKNRRPPGKFNKNRPPRKRPNTDKPDKPTE